jgi:hypothetical protein
LLFVVGYGLFVGLLLPLLWAVRATRRHIRPREARWLTGRELRSRLAAEFSTSGLLLITALGLLWRLSWAAPLHVLAMGMLVYSFIRSLSDMEDRVPWPYRLVAGALFAGAIGSLILLFRSGSFAVNG